MKKGCELCSQHYSIAMMYYLIQKCSTEVIMHIIQKHSFSIHLLVNLENSRHLQVTLAWYNFTRITHFLYYRFLKDQSG